MAGRTIEFSFCNSVARSIIEWVRGQHRLIEKPLEQSINIGDVPAQFGDKGLAFANPLNCGAPETNRTSDLPLRRGLLYPLSYRGVGRPF